MSKILVRILLLADELGHSERSVNTAVESIYDESETVAAVAERAGVEAWSRFLAVYTTYCLRICFFKFDFIAFLLYSAK